MYTTGVFQIYAITLQLRHFCPVSKATKLLKSKFAFLTIQIFSSKYLKKTNKTTSAKIKRVARIHATSKMLLGMPYVDAIYLD